MQILSTHPTEVGASNDRQFVVKNLGPSTVFFRSQEAVSSSLNDGNVTEGNSTTITAQTYFICAAGNSTDITVTAASPENIGTGQVANSSITEPKLGTAAVTVVKTKVKTDAVPVAGESLTAVAGTSGVGRIIAFGYTAKAEASAKVKLIHNLGTTQVVVQAYTTTAKIAAEALGFGEELKGAIAKVTIISANEVELTLKAAVPGAKEEFIYVVTG